MINLVIVGNNDIVRDALERILSDEDDSRVIAALSSGQETLDALQSGLAPDVILADLSMNGMNGIALTRKVVKRYEDVAVIILRMHDKSSFRKEAMAPGTKEYLLKAAIFPSFPAL